MPAFRSFAGVSDGSATFAGDLQSRCQQEITSLSLPKTICERKRIRPGTSLRITEVGDGFYVTPVPEPTEAELAAVFRVLDEGRRTGPITAEDEAQIQDEIKKCRAEQRRRKA